MIKIVFKKVHPDARIFEYQTKGSSGADVYALEDVVLYPKDIGAIRTGIAVSIPEGYEMQIRPRSGMGKKGIIIPNSPGTVDSDYRGEILVLLQNNSKEEPVKIQKGDRIAQAVLMEVPKAIYTEGELDDTLRGTGGFGSTGVR